MPIPEGVKSIVYRAFEYCSLLTTVTIPESVISIGYLNFWGCTSLETIYNYSEIPQEIDGDAFFHDVPATMVIYVPKGCRESYAQASGWSEFTIIEMDKSNSVGTGCPDNSELRVYSLGSVLYISGYDGVDNVAVYSQHGKMLFNGFSGEVPLSVDNEIIILSVGEKTYKLFVR